jgi:hypothetical protein
MASGEPVEAEKFETFIIRKGDPNDLGNTNVEYFVAHEIETFKPGDDGHKTISELFAEGYRRNPHTAAPVRKKRSVQRMAADEGIITARINISDG